MYFISKKGTVARLFFMISFAGLFMYTILAFYTIHTAFTSGFKLTTFHESIKQLHENYTSEDDETKYILLWTLNGSNINPFGEGGEPFFAAGCLIKNCFITTNKKLLNGDYTHFHAVIYNFSIQRIMSGLKELKRSPHQKYVFYNMQPSESHPVCSTRVENFFNWTWTYKLNSDIFTPFIYVKNKRGRVIAPDLYTQWDSEMTELKEEMMPKAKSQSVSWVIDNCKAMSKGALSYAKRLKAALQENNLYLDIYGCGFNECPKEDCLKVIDKYSFYLAHEGSFSEDYVSNEVLKAYNHQAVPIVIGGADYRKFLPPASYINGQNMSVEALASFIGYTIRNPDIYNNYFSWKSYYTVERYNINQGLCKLCSYLHDDNKYKTYSSYKNFRKWWYHGSLKDHCLPKGAETFAEILSYIKSTSQTKKDKAL